MKLTGLVIAVNNEQKFVGKVGRVPANTVLPAWVGKVALYREVPYSQVYSYQTKSVGVDQAAWEKAVELGAQGMIVYCPDKYELFVASNSLMEISAVVDLGEYPQIRVPVSDVSWISVKQGLPFGWTKNLVQVGADRRQVVSPETPDVSNVQLGLF